VIYLLLVKEKQDELNEDLLRDLIGRIIDVPINEHEVLEGVTNLWFGGRVAGYCVTKLYYNFKEEDFTEEKICKYDIVLTDGEGFPVSDSCEIWFLTEDEFTEKMTNAVTEKGEEGDNN
jgi:hypothetical protein